jgi:hypothetical protein
MTAIKYRLGIDQNSISFGLLQRCMTLIKHTVLILEVVVKLNRDSSIGVVIAFELDDWFNS